VEYTYRIRLKGRAYPTDTKYDSVIPRVYVISEKTTTHKIQKLGLDLDRIEYIAVGSILKATVTPNDRRKRTIELSHSLSDLQLKWLKTRSALNYAKHVFEGEFVKEGIVVSKYVLYYRW
jgi:hypothetical protein